VTKARLFVLVQLVSILLIFLECGILTSPPSLFIQLFALIVGIWSILQFKFQNLAISPVPKEKAELIQSGPYRFIRNPMYLSVLLFCAPIALEKGNIISLSLLLVLLVDLILKIEYEEELLKSKFSDYRNYCKGSKKLIPFIY